MINDIPIYSQIQPKSQYKRNTKTKPEFDPLNFNSGGNFLNTDKMEKNEKKEKRKEDRKKKNEGEGKVEAYLRQYQVSMRQHQRHSAVRQAEHRVNLRSLPLNEVTSARGHDRTPTDRHRGFPERERDSAREHRRERERERDRENFEFDGTPLSPIPRHDKERPVRKSTSSQRVTEAPLNTDKRKFYCREWAFQKIAHCLEQRSVSKTCGAFIIGDAGSGKTALCQELSEPGPGPQARQQRSLNRRLLAKYFLESNTESSMRPGEFVRSIAMQILGHSSREQNLGPDSCDNTPHDNRRDSDEERMIQRFRDMGDDGEESSKPLLADCEERTDSEDGCRRSRTIDRIHERDNYTDSIASQLPEIHPRTSIKQTNPFTADDHRLYENHENLFLRNVSQRQSKEVRNSRITRQSSEPLSERDRDREKVNERKVNVLQKSLSTETKESEVKDSPPKSRIPVASFRYPNKSDLKSAENSPKKTDKIKEVEYQNIMTDNGNCSNEINEGVDTINGQGVNGKVDSDNGKVNDSINGKVDSVNGQVVNEKGNDNGVNEEDVPPPIPSLPVNPRTLIANAYYDKLLSEPEIQQALLPQNLEKNPDDCFKKAFLFPLLEIDPPKHCLFLLVDGIDEGNVNVDESESCASTSIATLLARHQHLLPQWLLLVCTARPKPKRCSVSSLFTGFRKISLDELGRAHVAADVQRYVLARLDAEPRLRARVSSDSTAAAAAAAALDHLRIKSDGCLLYLEKVLDGVADGFIALREIKEIPGTLNGLYLWLAQRLFHGRRFNKVRLLLEVLLAARCGVTEEMLYKCLLTKEYSVTREDFNRRMHLLRRVLVVERGSGSVRIFHSSFRVWLTDVKHCTRRYLCAPREGHAALAMYHTLTATRLSALEIHNFVYHMIYLEQHMAAQKKNKTNDNEDEVLDLHTLSLLWILDSGCDVESALKREPEIALSQTDTHANETDDREGSEASGVQSLARLMPALTGAWPRDVRVQRALLEMTRQSHQTQALPPVEEPEEEKPVIPEEPEDLSLLDPNILLELVSKGDEETLVALLKRFPQLSTHACSVSALQLCARGGAARCVRALLAAGAPPDAPDADGWSPLRAAAWAGHVEVVDVLLEYGCDVDCVDADNRTALRAAAWSGHLAVVQRLLSAGADPERGDAEGRTALLAAAYMGHADIVRALLAAGAQIDTADHDGRTALAVSCLCAGGAECAGALLERGADVHKHDRDGATPLLVAAFEGHTDICELLLEAEADLEAVDSLGRTALWAAAAAGHARTVRLLLFWGACVDNMDAEGRTVLSIAAAQGNVEVVRQLLDRGLDEHHRDNSGWTPLHYAAFEGHVEVCEVLLEAGAKVEECDNEGKAALLLAAQEGHAALVEALADTWRAPVDQHAHDGKTALRLAALEGHFAVVEALVARGADVDAVDADRRTALYVLALDNRLAMAKFLIHQCGASLDITDNEGRTALHVCAWQGHTDMVRVLVGAGARLEARDGCRRTALHAAAWRGRDGALRALLALGARPDALCTQGATPLGIAAQEGHEECVIWLLQYGADPLQADHCGRTPAKVAWRAGHANICRLLERWAATHQDTTQQQVAQQHVAGSPEYKRRSVHSSNSTKSSSNMTGGSARSHDNVEPDVTAHDKPNRANLSLSFAQQVARCGRSRRDKDRDSIPENSVPEKESKLSSASNRSYLASERDRDMLGYLCERDRRRDERHGGRERDTASPLYASPPRSPASDLCSPTQPFGSQPPSLSAVQPAMSDTHFNRDTHMRIILGRDSKPTDRQDSVMSSSKGRNAYNKLFSSIGRARGRIFKKTKNKRNGIVTNPAMRLVANVRNGLDNAAANIRRTGVALAASASSANPAVKTNAFQWRKETPL